MKLLKAYRTHRDFYILKGECSENRNLSKRKQKRILEITRTWSATSCPPFSEEKSNVLKLLNLMIRTYFEPSGLVTRSQMCTKKLFAFLDYLQFR